MPMWELKFYARGGQGAVTAARILVEGAILEGKYAQAIPSYGQERQGAPVYAFARVAEEIIEVKSYVYTPNCIVVFDPGLPKLGVDIYEGLQPGSVMVVNSPHIVDFEHQNIGTFAVIDANRITQETIGKVPPNMAMLGAVVRATNCCSIENLIESIQANIGGKAGALNAEACKRAFKETVLHEKV